MGLSNSVSTTVFNTNSILDQAFRRCKIPPETVSSEMQNTALDSLYLLISSLCNMGLQLWTVEKIILPFYLANGYITMPVGTVDLLNSNYRYLNQFTPSSSTASQGSPSLASDNNLSTACTQTSPNGYITYNLGSQQTVTTLGVNMLSAGTYDIVISWSNDNINFTDVLTPGSTVYTANMWEWYDINPNIAAQYWKIRGQNGTILDVAEFVVAGSPTEIPFARLNQDDYTNLPNKNFQGRPLQFWLDRQLTAPVARLWPVPNESAQFAQFVTWRKRHIMDVGSLQQTIEVPQRWVDAIIWNLAARLCYEIQQVDINLADKIGPLADRSLQVAMAEEYDNSPFMVAPNISMYTR